MSGEWQITHLLNTARKTLQTLEHLAIDLINPVALVNDIRGFLHEMSTPPPGDPAAIEALAATLRLSSTKLGIAHDELNTHSTGLPDVMVGVAAGTAGQAMTALVTATDNERTGLDLGATALTDYAADLKAARAEHARATSKFDDAGTHLSNSLDHHITVFGFDTHIPDPIAAVKDIGKAVGEAIDGVRIAVHSYEMAQTALYALQRHASDSSGYALLAAAPVVTGFSVLDTAVMASQFTIGTDPDHRILDPDQWAKVQAAVSKLSPADRAAFEDLLKNAGSPTARAALFSAMAAGGTLPQLTYLSDAMKGMSEDEITTMLSLNTDAVTGGATLNGKPVIEDPNRSVTCGSTSLLAMLARKDPMLALWLTTGKRTPGWNPPYLSHLTDKDWAQTDFSKRFYAAQGSVLTTTDRDVTLWPTSLGTPPWAADEVASMGGSPYESVMMDDQDPALTQKLMSRVAVAANSGKPVPIYVGDDHFPRHVVLVTGYSNGLYTLYDPSDGEVAEVPEAVMLGKGGTSQTVFGNWSRVDWVIVPKN